MTITGHISDVNPKLNLVLLSNGRLTANFSLKRLSLQSKQSRIVSLSLSRPNGKAWVSTSSEHSRRRCRSHTYRISPFRISYRSCIWLRPPLQENSQEWCRWISSRMVSLRFRNVSKCSLVVGHALQLKLELVTGTQKETCSKSSLLSTLVSDTFSILVLRYNKSTIGRPSFCLGTSELLLAFIEWNAVGTSSLYNRNHTNTFLWWLGLYHLERRTWCAWRSYDYIHCVQYTLDVWKYRMYAEELRETEEKTVCNTLIIFQYDLFSLFSHQVSY